MRRVIFAAIGLLALAGVAWGGVTLFTKSRPPIRVGLLHSLTGPLRISETAIVDGEVLAIKEINDSGGLLGRKVESVVADGGSDPDTFEREARRLIVEEKVSVIVGCLSSASRKRVKSVVERYGHLLIYPAPFEGMELSPNVIYAGAAPNQQMIPAVKWCRDLLKAKTFFLIGSESTYARAGHAIIGDEIKAIGGRLVGAEFLGDLDGAIAKAVAAKPDVILNMIEGDVNIQFYKKIRATPNKAVPVFSLNLTEEELRHLPVASMTNDYLVCNYLQRLDRPENAAFLARYKALYGADRAAGDTVATGRTGVLLWAQAVRDAGTDDVKEVRPLMGRQSLDAPEGVVTVDSATGYLWRPVFIGKVRGDGQADVVWNSLKPVYPVPFPFSRTRAEWEEFAAGLEAGPGVEVTAPDGPQPAR